MRENLVPRQSFFSNPDIGGVKISPDGHTISYLAPDQGVLNIWIAPLDNLKNAKVVTQDRHRGIRSYAWSYQLNTILYVQDCDGDEDWHIFKLDTDTLSVTDLTPFHKIHARIEKLSPDHPDHMLIALNNRRPDYHDIYRVDLTTGALDLVFENNDSIGLIYDDALELKMRGYIDHAGNMVYTYQDQSKLDQTIKVDHQDVMTTQPLHFMHDGQLLYMIDSRGRNTAALTAIDQTTGQVTTIYENDTVDIAGTLSDRKTGAVKAVCFTYDYRKWQVIDPAWQNDFTLLSDRLSGEIDIISRCLSDTRWIIQHLRDDAPVEFYLLDRLQQTLTFLFINRQSIANIDLCKMRPQVITTRDHLNMMCYLTLPRAADPQQTGSVKHPVPLILLVHGGPNVRDVWGYDPQHQWLANRGYGVLSVNYRGSTGFGKDFINAGNGEWSLKMHDDLIDAVEWAIDQGITTRDKVAIMGGSYGGYATLVGLTMTPDVFCCGVNIVGVSNLKTLLASLPAYWQPVIQLMKIKLGGDLASPHGEAELVRRSPLFKAHQIKKPLLIGHGANDPRVKIAESEQIVAKMKQNNIPVTYAVFADEGHGFARPENRLAFFALTEAFLQQHLGGACEAVNNDFEGSSIQIIDGDSLIALR